jgi:hypothetical protein
VWRTWAAATPVSRATAGSRSTTVIEGRAAMCSAVPGRVRSGLDQGAGRGEEMPAGFGVSAVDEAGDQAIAAAGGDHGRVVENDVQGCGHRAAGWWRRRSSSASRSSCSASMGS